jgi:hypothetical protein
MTESLNIVTNELQDSWRRLCQRWHATTQIWDDRVRRQFEKEFWQPLDAQVTATQRELEQLAHGISKSHHSVH